LLLLLGRAGLQLLELVIDVIRHALDPAQRAPVYPFGWMPLTAGADCKPQPRLTRS
jgi:hypothetical protein